MTGEWTIVPTTEQPPDTFERLLQPGDLLAIDDTTLVRLTFAGEVVETSRTALESRYGTTLATYVNFCGDGVIRFQFSYRNDAAVGNQPRTFVYELWFSTVDLVGNAATGYEGNEVTTQNEPTPNRVVQPRSILRRRPL